MAVTYPTLYKRTSTGAVQIWFREVDGSRYRTTSGQEFGAKVTSEWTQATAKNVGRSNEVSAEDQAHLETEAAYTKKQNQGRYHISKDDIDNPLFFDPMLANKYDAAKVAKIGFSYVFSQPKLDGMRCIVNADGMWTRKGKSIDSCPHIFEALKPWFEEDPDLILDGELYADKLKDDFGEIMSLCRKQKPDSNHFAKTADVVKYHVYDLPSCDGTFSVRYSVLASLGLPDPIVYVETTAVQSQEALDALNGSYLSNGYEGQIVRIDDKPYESKRSNSLLKRKEFIDEEFEVISVEEGLGNRSGMAGFILYRLPNGDTFGSGIKGGFAYYRELLRDREKYVGGQGTVRFFGYSPDGIPRFPVTVMLYEGERDT